MCYNNLTAGVQIIRCRVFVAPSSVHPIVVRVVFSVYERIMHYEDRNHHGRFFFLLQDR